jgi:hypothetical protein
VAYASFAWRESRNHDKVQSGQPVSGQDLNSKAPDYKVEFESLDKEDKYVDSIGKR